MPDDEKNPVKLIIFKLFNSRTSMDLIDELRAVQMNHDLSRSADKILILNHYEVCEPTTV